MALVHLGTRAYHRSGLHGFRFMQGACHAVVTSRRPTCLPWNWYALTFGLWRAGYGLAWSPFMEGHLLSGSDDAQICLWDINSVTKTGRKIEARSIFREHLGVVEVRGRAPA